MSMKLNCAKNLTINKPTQRREKRERQTNWDNYFAEKKDNFKVTILICHYKLTQEEKDSGVRIQAKENVLIIMKKKREKKLRQGSNVKKNYIGYATYLSQWQTL